MRLKTALPRRLLNKLIHDVLPAALASVIGGVLFTHFQLGRAPEPPAAAPASAQMMQLLRDEHAQITNFVRAEVAKEKAQVDAANAAAEAKPALRPAVAAAAVEPPAAIATLRPVVTATMAAKPAPRGKPVVITAALPLVIAQAQSRDALKPAAAADASSLLAKTIGFKDHVVAVTQRVVSVIGGIPSWIGSIGDHIGGQAVSPRPPADLVSAS